ncbi:flagellar hook-length control protein FliK [Roseibium album]|uniref:Flagellar hook-length control protein FliK n=1 Tax=Roseibium album TaxID=311410 RepID=A0A0M7AIW6_9HYPH|nr:flagellar hook-length control protein FliK [Roseibium album]CTQ60316.1 Flagellar hook-length control protein FliK [Roseibium album]CTQ74366.1 Flagellar hook-length control protein FliK [Roseibium album]
MVETVSAQPLTLGPGIAVGSQRLEPGLELKAKVETNLPGGVVRLVTADAKIDLRVRTPLPPGTEVVVTVTGSRQNPAIQITIVPPQGLDGSGAQVKPQAQPQPVPQPGFQPQPQNPSQLQGQLPQQPQPQPQIQPQPQPQKVPQPGIVAGQLKNEAAGILQTQPNVAQARTAPVASNSTQAPQAPQAPQVPQAPQASQAPQANAQAPRPAGPVFQATAEQTGGRALHLPTGQAPVHSGTTQTTPVQPAQTQVAPRTEGFRPGGSFIPPGLAGTPAKSTAPLQPAQVTVNAGGSPIDLPAAGNLPRVSGSVPAPLPGNSTALPQTGNTGRAPAPTAPATSTAPASPATPISSGPVTASAVSISGPSSQVIKPLLAQPKVGTDTVIAKGQVSPAASRGPVPPTAPVSTGTTTAQPASPGNTTPGSVTQGSVAQGSVAQGSIALGGGTSATGTVAGQSATGPLPSLPGQLPGRLAAPPGPLTAQPGVTTQSAASPNIAGPTVSGIVQAPIGPVSASAITSGATGAKLQGQLQAGEGLRVAQSQPYQPAGLTSNSRESAPTNVAASSTQAPVREIARQLMQPLGEQQSGLGNLFAQVGSLMSAQASGQVSMPDPVVKAMQQILGLRLNTVQKPTAAGLQQAVRHSGQFREANLVLPGQGSSAGQGDLKSVLLSFRSILQQFGSKGQVTRPASQPSVPTLQGPPQAQAQQAASGFWTGAAPQNLQSLLKETDAALARMRMTQLVNSGLAGDERQKLGTRPMDIVLELPLSLGQETAVMQMQVGRDGSGQEEGDEDEQAWRLRFALDLTATGPLEAAVSLRGGGTFVSLWVDRKETFDNLNSVRESVEASFADAGLDLQEFRLVRGLPPKTAAKYGALIDRQS